MQITGILEDDFLLTKFLIFVPNLNSNESGYKEFDRYVKDLKYCFFSITYFNTTDLFAINYTKLGFKNVFYEAGLIKYYRPEI